jgi:hypothetical protein
MQNLFYVCDSQEIAVAINAQIEANMALKRGGVWDIPRQRMDGKWVVSYSDDPNQAWRFAGVTGYEAIEAYNETWWD